MVLSEHSCPVEHDDLRAQQGVMVRAAVTAGSQQGAGVRSLVNEARSKMSLLGGEKMRSCRGMPFIPPPHPTPPHLQMHISHPASRSCSHQPAPFPLPLIPPESWIAFIYLIKTPGTPFHAQPWWLFSPSGEAVKLSIIARPSGTKEEHDCRASEWNLRGTFGGRCGESDSR